MASTAIAAISLVSGLAGTALQYKGASDAASASAKIEKQRKRKLNLDVARSRRERIREAIIARAQALSNASAQGASDTSAIEGGVAQVSNRLTQNLNALNQDQEIGLNIFKQNEKIAQGQETAAFGQGVSSFSNQLYNISSSPLFRTA